VATRANGNPECNPRVGILELPLTQDSPCSAFPQLKGCFQSGDGGI
jgi:hypothetical protein